MPVAEYGKHNIHKSGGAVNGVHHSKVFERTRKLVPNRNEKVRFGERDRPGRSARRPAGRCLHSALSHDLPAGRPGRSFRPEAENGRRQGCSTICQNPLAVPPVKKSHCNRPFVNKIELVHKTPLVKLTPKSVVK